MITPSFVFGCRRLRRWKRHGRGLPGFQRVSSKRGGSRVEEVVKTSVNHSLPPVPLPVPERRTLVKLWSGPVSIPRLVVPPSLPPHTILLTLTLPWTGKKDSTPPGVSLLDSCLNDRRGSYSVGKKESHLVNDWWLPNLLTKTRGVPSLPVFSGGCQVL